MASGDLVTTVMKGWSNTSSALYPEMSQMVWPAYMGAARQYTTEIIHAKETEGETNLSRRD